MVGWDESGNAIINGVSYVNHAGRITEFYTYDRMNRLSTVSTGAFDTNWNALPSQEAIRLDTRLYDGASRVVQSGPAGSLSNDYIQALTNGRSDANGAITRVSRYDADGHLLSLHTTKPDGSFSSDQVYQKVTTWQTQDQVQTGTDESGAPIYTTQTVNHSSVSSGYDAAGNVTNYQMTDSSGVTEYFSTTYAKFEGYKEATVSGYRSDNAGQMGTTTDGYDANGDLISVTDSTKGANDRTFVNDANGNILQKTQQGNVLKQLVVDGQVYGTYGTGEDPVTPTNGNGDPNYADLTNFNLSYQPITNAYPGASTGQYTIRSGDTLRSIAQQAYGDSELWYQIADANELRGDDDLRVGQTLTIPNRVASAHNTSSSFKPYDPSKVVGDTTPNLPVPQQDGGGGCGGLGGILVLIVTVVVTVIAQQYELLPEEVAAELGAAAPVAEAMLDAAVGNIAGQAVGNAVGVEHGFDWQSLGTSVVSAGVTQGVGVGGLGNSVAGAALTNAMTQGIEVATGLQHSFSWQQVAIAAAGSAASSVAQVGADSAMGYDPSQGFDFGKDLISGTISGIAAGVTASVMRGGRLQIAQLAADAFGNALGESLAQDASTQSGTQADTLAQTEQQVMQSSDVGQPGDAVLFGPLGNGASGPNGALSGSNGFDTEGAYNQLVDAFSAAPIDSGAQPGMLLASNDLTQPGQPIVATDAGGGSLDAHDARVAEFQAEAAQMLAVQTGYNADGTYNILVTGTTPPDEPVGTDPTTGTEGYAVPAPEIQVTPLDQSSPAPSGGTSETPFDAFIRGAEGGYAGVLDPNQSAARVGSYVNDAWHSFTQFGREMSGAVYQDEAIQQGRAGHYVAAVGREMQAFGQAGLTLFGLGEVGSAAAPLTGTVLRSLGDTAYNAVTRYADLTGARLSIVGDEAGSTTLADQVQAAATRRVGTESDKTGGATFGNAVSTDYRTTFFDAYPDLQGQVVVHHAVEQQVLTRYPGLVWQEEIHSLENLRGIPNELNSDLHLSQIRREWNQFYRQTPNPTKDMLLEKATEIDAKYGSQFNPPVDR
ncbi:LysM domain-containing protein [Trinickia symbiotica]|uniref:LysM peptidoglycan-binding domain-containing protein n=1 Tax=Trinickia symbiotica TaxID=863227 RepID=UPI00039A211A|nr:LysM peptidoglycan-binding domain-containing protein [Trinickia symbiotica]PPK44426.1 LysM domain-containing protein [Trinickia symbiotica]